MLAKVSRLCEHQCNILTSLRLRRLQNEQQIAWVEAI